MLDKICEMMKYERFRKLDRWSELHDLCESNSAQLDQTVIHMETNKSTEVGLV